MPVSQRNGSSLPSSEETGRDWSYLLISAGTVLCLLVLWWVIAGAGIVGALPSPSELVGEFARLVAQGYAGKSLLAHVWASVFRAVAGLLLAMVVGIPLGLLIGFSRTVSAVFSPVIAFVRPIPPIAFVPLFVVWFGIGEISKVLVIFMVSLWYLLINCAAGVVGISRDYLRSALNLGVTRRQLFTDVILPLASPDIITGIKTAIGVSWALVVAAELIGAQEGIGFIIMDGALFNRTTAVYIGIVMIGFIGFLLERGAVFLESRLLHWRGR